MEPIEPGVLDSMSHLSDIPLTVISSFTLFILFAIFSLCNYLLYPFVTSIVASTRTIVVKIWVWALW